MAREWHPANNVQPYNESDIRQYRTEGVARGRHQSNRLGVFAGILLVLIVLAGLGERVVGEEPPPVAVEVQPETDLVGVPEVEVAPPDTVSTDMANMEGAAQAPNLDARLSDGEMVQVAFASGLSITGTVQIADQALIILNPLGQPVDWGEVAALVKADGQTLLPADLGIEAVPTPAPTAAEDPATVETATLVVEAELVAEGGMPVQVNGLDNGLSVSEILDRYPAGTLFVATLQDGTEVVAMKENRIKLVRVNQTTGAVSKTIVPPWAIVSLQPVP